MNFDLKTVLRLLSPGDKILAAFLVIVSLFSFVVLKGVHEPGQVALVSIQGLPKLRKDLTQNQKFVFDGPIGKTTVEIKTHSIRVLDSECPQKLCVRQGMIRNTGEIIVCVPNKITIWIEGNRRNKFDAITG